MKGFKKLFVMIALAGSSLFVSTPCADASIAGDAALLAQQIAQFFQDFNFDLEKWQDVSRRLNEVKKLSRVLNNGSQAWTSVNNIINTSQQIVRCGEKIESYNRFLKRQSTAFRIERCHDIYIAFMRRSGNLYDEIQKTLKQFASLTDLKPLEMIQAVDAATTSFSETVTGMSDIATNSCVELCYSTVQDEIVDQNASLFGMNWL